MQRKRTVSRLQDEVASGTRGRAEFARCNSCERSHDVQDLSTSNTIVNIGFLTRDGMLHCKGFLLIDFVAPWHYRHSTSSHRTVQLEIFRKLLTVSSLAPAGAIPLRRDHQDHRHWLVKLALAIDWRFVEEQSTGGALRLIPLLHGQRQHLRV